MEYLDYYDEEGNYLGFETREVVHKEGLWHKTVHNWLYTKDGNVIFQIRKDSNKFYTTSSGHVDKGETVEEAFKRETKEEIGLDMDTTEAQIVDVVTWKMDKIKKDGSLMKDRAKASVFIAPYEGDCSDFLFDPEEVLGVVFVDVRKTLELFENKVDKIPAIMVHTIDGKNVKIEKNVTIDDFLVMPGENAYDKYSQVLKKIIEVTE